MDHTLTEVFSNAIESAPDMESVWIQSERTNEEIISKASSHFTKVRKNGTTSKNLYQVRIIQNVITIR